MVKAIRFEKTGGPEVMKWVDVEVGEPGNGEIRIKQHVVGLNYIVSIATFKSKQLESLIEGRPQVIIHNGHVFEDVMTTHTMS